MTVGFYDLFDPPQAPAALRLVEPVAAEGDTAYGLAALASECETVADAIEGTRNDGLNRAWFRMGRIVATGQLTEQTARARLTEAARSCGLPDAEIADVLRTGPTGGLSAGQRAPRIPEPLRDLHTVTEVAADLIAAPPGHVGDDTDTPERTSWWPEPVAALADKAATEPLPTHLIRDDGRALLYSGKVNTLIGESESGKSWVALHAVQQALTDRQRCLILDFEDTAATTRDRLALLGALPEDLALLDYAHPDQALDILAARDLDEALTRGYRVIVVDGINYAMTLLGLDLNSNTDANIFNGKILAPLAATGACVIGVDHVPKNAEQRGKGAIGAQAKRAMISGCILKVEVMEPFGQGISGTLKLWVDKDRPGHVRGASGGGKYAGQASVDSGDEQVRIEIRAGQHHTREGGDDVPGWQPTYLMEQVSRLLETTDGALSSAAIEREVKGKRDTIRAAVFALIDGGWIRRESGSRNTILHDLIEPYRDGDKPPRPTSPRPRPDLAPGEVKTTSPLAPHPRSGGGEVRASVDGHPGDLAHDENRGEVKPGHAACRQCGESTPAGQLAAHRGYCTPCGQDKGL